jgi:hypothetical protein
MTPTRLRDPRPRRAGRLALAGLLTTAVAVAGVAAVPVAAAPAIATSAGAASSVPARAGAGAPDLGPHVVVFDPSMPVSEIRATFDRIHAEQVDDEMGGNRWSLLFRPGSYGTVEEPLQVKVGYYTEVAGLGADPGDVRINGKIEVYNRCSTSGTTTTCNALTNFWRTISNLTIDVNGRGQSGCRAAANFWAVSQAVSMRRVDVRGGTLSLMDYCTAGPHYASGGFVADSRAGAVTNGSQQQWLTRNSTVGSWSNGVWNQVFAGVEGAPDDSGFPTPPYTTLGTTPVSREKPWVYVDDAGRWMVRVPDAGTETRGTSWSTGMTPGRSLPLSAFHVARPGDSVASINRALARGQHLLLTPGVYDIDRSIEVRRAHTVVLGLGHATLTAVDGATPLTVWDRPGTVVAGVTVDAGSELSSVLVRVGRPGGSKSPEWARSNADDPLTLADLYFRVGGPHIGKTERGLVIDADHVLVDHTWVWRADHGLEDFTGGVLGDDERWAVNTGTNGVVVGGDDVTATGLFVEHFQERNTVWNGERGRVVLYQNELPYDPPTQADWTQPDGTLGWPGYVVGDGVQEHRLWGGGVYVFNRNDPAIVTERGFDVPNTPGVRLTHVLTVNLTAGTIRRVVGDLGAQVDSSNTGRPSYVTEYP